MDTTRFGAALRHARETYVEPGGQQRKLSIREAARRAGISEPRWRHYEAGTQIGRDGKPAPTRPSPENAASAARAVGLDVAEALQLAGYDPDSFADLTALGAEPRSEHVPGFAKLTPRQRQKVIELVQAILDTDDEPAGVRPGQAPPDIATRGTVLGRADDDAGQGSAEA